MQSEVPRGSYCYENQSAAAVASTATDARAGWSQFCSWGHCPRDGAPKFGANFKVSRLHLRLRENINCIFAEFWMFGKPAELLSSPLVVLLLSGEFTLPEAQLQVSRPIPLTAASVIQFFPLQTHTSYISLPIL